MSTPSPCEGFSIILDPARSPLCTFSQERIGPTSPLTGVVNTLQSMNPQVRFEAATFTTLQYKMSDDLSKIIKNGLLNNPYNQDKNL